MSVNIVCFSDGMAEFFGKAAEAVAYAKDSMNGECQIAFVSEDKKAVEAVKAVWKKSKPEEHGMIVSNAVMMSNSLFYGFAGGQEDDGDEVEELLAFAFSKAKGEVAKPAAAKQESLPAHSAGAKAPYVSQGVDMNSENEVKKNVIKLYVTLFDRGGRQVATGHRIVTAAVSNPYYNGKTNPDGSKGVSFYPVLNASMILPEAYAKEFAWEEYVNSNTGKKEYRTRASFYGTIDKDRRVNKLDNGMVITTFWANPVFRKKTGVKEDGSPKWDDCDESDPDGRLMIFPLERRRPDAAKAAPAAAPVVEAQKVVEVAKAAKAKKTAKTTKTSAAEEMRF